MNIRIQAIKVILPWIIGLWIFLFLPHTSVSASGEFQADYDVQYAITPGGVTIVTQNVSLTNNLSNVYPQKYLIIIDSVNIQKIIAYDSGGVIRPDIKQNEGKTEITLTFNEKNVGLGKKFTFSLRYENTDIAVKNGSIWEVTIPGVGSDPDLASYFVTLQVPTNFGANAYMSPRPASGNRWTKDQMTQGGISAAYGTKQGFDIELSYFLENPTLSGVLTEIALPPDTAYQKVFIRSLIPEPKTVLVDDEGNWLAQYELLPTQRLQVKALATVVISLIPRDGYSQKLEDATVYTQPAKYWEVSDTRIGELARKYNTPRLIYDYVVRTLTYDYKRAQSLPVRKGAVSTLDTPSNAICMEFTDLFIAIARAAGIPAREAVGYAYTTNAKLRPLSFVSDVLHAWPEYYDEKKQIWVPIDPTWSNTTGGVNYFDKLDFNHIVFAYHGKSSETPYPAGFYKKSGEHSKDVFVTFAESIPGIDTPNVSVEYNFPTKTTSGFSANGNVIVKNSGQTSISEIPVHIQSTTSDLVISKNLTLMPPYAAVSIPISMTNSNYLYYGNGSITTRAGDTVERFDYQVVPFYYQLMIPIIALLSAFAIFLILKIRSMILWKTRRRP